jgi:MoxR-like ATPase
MQNGVEPQPTGDVLRAAADLEASICRVVRGKVEAVRLSVACLLAGGHLLIEDVPGVGKTTLARALARAAGGEFRRVQCTADMLPGDILGVTVYNSQTAQFEFKRGPVFTSFLLADEINRATPKTQSALLEAMNEGQVTVDGHTYPLEAPFMVIATQNPAEHHGTYPLPESQLDRFLMRLRLGYPDPLSERDVLRTRPQQDRGEIPNAVSLSELLALQAQAAAVTAEDAAVDYLMSIVEKTRRYDAVALGVSPRGAQALFRAAQALAVLHHRSYLIPDDIKAAAIPVCAHRLALNTRAMMSQRAGEAAEAVMARILTEVAVPV